MKVGDRVTIVNSRYFQGLIGTIVSRTCATAFYVELDATGSTFNFTTSSLELLTEPCAAGYEELFI